MPFPPFPLFPSGCFCLECHELPPLLVNPALQRLHGGKIWHCKSQGWRLCPAGPLPDPVHVCPNPLPAFSSVSQVGRSSCPHSTSHPQRCCRGTVPLHRHWGLGDTSGGVFSGVGAVQTMSSSDSVLGECCRQAPVSIPCFPAHPSQPHYPPRSPDSKK